MNTITRVAFFVLLIAGCQNYYKTKPANINANSIDSLRLQNRYFILRSGSDAYRMKNISIGADKKRLHCLLDTLSPDHQLHLVQGRGGKMRYLKLKRSDLSVLNEVHLYISPDNAAVPGNYTLALDKVQKIEVIQHDRKRTTNSYVVGALGYTAGALTLTTIIILATKSSCPFVSGYTGNEFILQGELFGGAIYPQLARHDYLPLKLSPTKDNTLQIKISNELLERQYTDVADLWVVNHDGKTKVIPDERGNLYSISAPKKPLSAVFSNNKNATKALSEGNDNQLLHFDDTTSATGINHVILKFRKPSEQDHGKLLLTLKNSYWLDYLYGELMKGLGSYYYSYVRKQRTKPASEILKWVKKQQIPLEVSVKKNNGWEKIADITTVGPLAFREMVVPVSFGKTTDNIVEIKLSSGFMFWEIDAVAMDFTNDNNFSVEKLKPIQAIDEIQKNVWGSLVNEDGIHLAQPEIGNIATITYQWQPPADSSQKQSFILHTKGYYEHIRNFKGWPDFKFLKQFTQPNAFALYGIHQYKKVQQVPLESVAAK